MNDGGALVRKLLEDAPVAAMISKCGDGQIVYANRMARALGPTQNTCYGLLGLQARCAGCPVQRGQDDAPDDEFSHAVPACGYLLQAKRIEWDGEEAWLEYIKSAHESGSSEAELEAIIERMPCGVGVYCVREGVLTRIIRNAALINLLETTWEEVEQNRGALLEQRIDPRDYLLLYDQIETLLSKGGVANYTFRVLTASKEYRTIQVEGSGRRMADGSLLLMGLYTDVSEQMRLETELAGTNAKLEEIINAIPGGVAIYKLSDRMETVYFSQGVPTLSGYTIQEYQELCRGDAMDMTYREDTPWVLKRVQETVRTHGADTVEFRKQHRDGHIVWVRAQVKWMGEQDGCPLLHCVFHNISDIKQAQLEMEHLVNSIPGGIASYRVEGERIIATYLSDGAIALTGYTRAQYEAVMAENALNLIFEQDRMRVFSMARQAVQTGKPTSVSCRVKHMNGQIIWVHMNGRRMDSAGDKPELYVVLMGMSPEARLFQSIANETTGGIYVIARDSYDLLYYNESKPLFLHGQDCAGKKCYEALHGKSEPCDFCTLKTHEPDGCAHAVHVETGPNARSFTARFVKMDWNEIPAYVKYVEDVTNIERDRREKERIERYFQSIVSNLPGGVALIRYQRAAGEVKSEFISEGVARMMRVPYEELTRQSQVEPMFFVHPDDRVRTMEKLEAYIRSGEAQCEIISRLLCSGDGCVWVRSRLSPIQEEGGDLLFYVMITDITKEREEQERMRRQYREHILHHYRTPVPGALFMGHCNVTRDAIYEMVDYTSCGLRARLGTRRNAFFRGVADFITDAGERNAFLATFLNEPALAAFVRNEKEQTLNCFIHLPGEAKGRYVRFEVSLIEEPDTNDVTGILTATDITDQAVAERILQGLSITHYDFIADLDIDNDTYVLLAHKEGVQDLPPLRGMHSQRLESMREVNIVPKDRTQYFTSLDPQTIRRRLARENSYTITYSVRCADSSIHMKNLTISAVDMRIGRVCLVRSDITESVREQQGLLNMLAYTFELMGLIDIVDDRFIMYTREAVLQNLPPYTVERYSKKAKFFAEGYNMPEMEQEIAEQFSVKTMLARLAQKPEGYDVVFPHNATGTLHYKQINILWGDENHSTICVVRADVTEILAQERSSKKKLQDALALAEEASKAKSNFLSAMSHDIRTPMNAIVGMTTLARAHMKDSERLEDCLQKIASASKHLLGLINDILDMSQIERSQVTLSRDRLVLAELIAQLSAMMLPQAQITGIAFHIDMRHVKSGVFYADQLRIEKILINLLGNAIKFTPRAGRVDFIVEEIPALQEGLRVRYRFTISDTGVGISEVFLARLFEPFTRDQARVSGTEGTGLGLSIAKGLIDLMQGSIEVRSQLGKGTTFVVELEFDVPDGQSAVGEIAPDALAHSTALKGRRFLVAEDNQLNAEILTELTQMHGAVCDVAPDGAKALDMLCKAAPGMYDAILMDIQMPVMNGYDTARAVRALDRADIRSIPIIAMTANAFLSDVQLALDAGMNAHVAKPVNMDVLLDTLDKVLGPKGGE